MDTRDTAESRPMLDGLPEPYRRMLIGAGLAVIGAILTIGGYVWAALQDSGGRYYIFTGLMFWGGVQFLIGLGGLPAYLKARRSGDPWRLATHDPDVLDQLLPVSITHNDANVRAQAIAHIPLIAARYPYEQSAEYLALGLADWSPEVRNLAYTALLGIARDDATRGAHILDQTLNAFRRTPHLIERIPGGRATLNQFWYLLANQHAYGQWRATGTLPEIPPATAAELARLHEYTTPSPTFSQTRSAVVSKSNSAAVSSTWTGEPPPPPAPSASHPQSMLPAPLPLVTAEARPIPVRHCRHCGAKLGSSAISCDECGEVIQPSPLEVAAAPDQSTGAAHPRSIDEDQTNPTAKSNPPWASFDKPGTQRLREIILADLEKYRHGLAQRPHDAAGRAQWVRDHPDLHDYLYWCGTTQGIAARQESKDDEALVERYLAHLSGAP